MTQLAEFSDYQRVYSGLNLNQDKATKPQTVQIVRQGEATPYWFKVNPLYLDETGFDRYLFRPYARSLKGQIVKTQINGKRYQRLSLVSAQVGNRLIAPMVYQNTMTGVFFEAWFQQCLLPALTQKSVIILDNARFHRMGVLREMAEKLGHKVLPLAPYSPELNPIEKVWANIKRYLRTVLSDYAQFGDALLSYFYFN